MKRGRGSFKEEAGGGKPNVQSMSGDVGSISSKIWVPVAGLKSAKDLPTEQGKVVLVDTMAAALMDRGTNPTGAVSVVKYGLNTYCVSSSCASCKIPLTKAKILEPTEQETGKDPRLACDFCSATYNLRTGERVTNVQASGILGGIAKVLLSAQESAPLPVYELGEAKGKVAINIG
jgi:nitrite reductase/ring-hydroxylating ferredoxin subunit